MMDADWHWPHSACWQADQAWHEHGNLPPTAFVQAPQHRGRHAEHHPHIQTRPRSRR